MRIGVLTSIETRHRFFARTIADRFHVAAVTYAQPNYMSASVIAEDLTAEEASIVRGHFAERDRQEHLHFGHSADRLIDSAECGVRSIGPGELNTPESVEFFASRNVDTVVVYGTDLIKPPLLGFCPGRMFNLHLGLSPYYRGTATNFYPLLNDEPDMVGATIHMIDAGIDTGPILCHARPRIDMDDRQHTLGCKAIVAGIDAMIRVLNQLECEGSIVGIPQWKEPTGRLYLRKDYHPRQVVDLVRKMDSGLIRRFLERPKTSRRSVRLIGESTGAYSMDSPAR